VCDVDLTTGAAEVFTDQRRRGKWKDSRQDSACQAMVDEAHPNAPSLKATSSRVQSRAGAGIEQDQTLSEGFVQRRDL
jgi:hypothetical protein